MISPVQLRYEPAADAAPEAWFLPGDSPARWLEELARSGLVVLATRLFLVPHSVEDRKPAGLLVVPSPTDSISEPPAGIACRRIGERLFVPRDAVLHPPIHDAELSGLCEFPVSFYHPVFGLSGFEEEDALHVGDLIELPEERAANWNFARPGSPALPGLVSVVLRQPLSIGDLFGGAEKEIGSDPLAQLPPAPEEPREGMVVKASRGLRRVLAGGVAGILRRMPHTALRRTWLNDVEDWANRQLLGVSAQLERLRNKELHRLLRLLDTDPEAGLRQAIPMNQFAHRGTAPPGVRLGPRSLHFHPSQLGGRPADFWHVPPDLREVLRRRYRELADREMQQGCHRRAAYIYAKLLGDLISAANAFKQGKLFREAALLYEEHLRNPLEAARCLVGGGLLTEAVERYEKLGLWLDVADLQERLGDRDAAEQALRLVVNERLAQNDVLGAARLLEERLHAPDEALEILLRAWPSSPQAAGCLGAAFQLLARLGRHESALERLARFRREPVPEALVLPLVSALGVTAREYPHERVRHRAADFSRVLIAHRLQRPEIAGDEVARLLELLVGLAPEDRLLARDANRFLANRRAAALRTLRAKSPSASQEKPVVQRQFELPRQMQWLELRREWHWFYALGVTARRATLLRGVWSGEYQSLSWHCPADRMKWGFVMEPTAEQGRAVMLALRDGVALPQKRFPAADAFFHQECIAGTPSWLPTDGFPFAIGEDAVWTLQLAARRVILACHDKARGQLQRTIDVTAELMSDAEDGDLARVSLAVVANTVAVALGNRLVLTRGDGGLIGLELPGQAVRMFSTIPNARRGVAVMLDRGAVMYWLGASDCMRLDRDLPSAKGAFVPGGPLVLVSGPQVVLIDVDSRGVHGVTRLELTGQRAVGVSATAIPGEFGVLGERGEVLVYRIKALPKG